jgi:hypothetical protein
MSSLKIERDTFQRGPAAPSAVGSTATATKGGPLPGTSGKHPVAEAVGTAITGGKQNAGTKGYLRVRRHQARIVPSVDNRTISKTEGGGK